MTVTGTTARVLAFDGRGGTDTIKGGAGVDTIIGGDGNDNLYGKLGSDNLSGGNGNDLFYFDTKLGSTNKDTISDFNKFGNDTMKLENAIFTKLAAGSLKTAAFYAGTKAHDADDRIIYNKGTGALYYDDDGTGSHAQVQFATLSNKPTLTVSDFSIV
jgi:Ca2+-binding RTX toxin-like protein